MSEDNYFGCRETPVALPLGFVASQLPPCVSCTLRLSSKEAGTGAVRDSPTGLSITESPAVAWTINGIVYNLLESFLVFPGAHRLEGRQTPCDAEYLLFFRAMLDGEDRQSCLCIPIDIGSGPSAPYFRTLDTSVRAGRPVLSTILPAGTQVMSYRGADLRGRSSKDAQPRSFCDPVKRTLTYYVCLTPTKMEAPDFARLKSLAPSHEGPARPAVDAMPARLLKLGTLIHEIVLETNKKKARVKGEGVPTEAMKCVPLDPDRDIVGDKVYIGGKKQTSLRDELSSDAPPAAEDASIQPGDIESTIGLIIGIAIGLVLCAMVGVFLWSHAFGNYNVVTGAQATFVRLLPTFPTLNVSPFLWFLVGGGIAIFFFGLLIGFLLS